MAPRKRPVREAEQASSDDATGPRPTSADAPPATHGRKAQGEQTKQAILDAALDLYAETGFRGTGLIAIGERAGVTHATVLYHYGSSHELLMAVLEERERRFREHTMPAFEPGGLEAIRNLPMVARFNVEQPVLAKLFSVLQAENLDPESEAHAFFLGRRTAIRKMLMSLLRQGRRAGAIREDFNIGTKADEILAFTTGAQIQYSLDPDHIDLVELYEVYTEALVRDLTRGVRRRPTGKT